MKAVAGIVALLSLTVFALPDVSAALDSGTVDPTSSVFMFFCGMLVFIMAPAIALFYGGMLRKQSMTSMMAQCLGVMGLVMVIWWVVGYSLAAGGDGQFIGNLDYIFGSGLSIEEGNGNIPTLQFFLFQGFFAIVTSCIVFGATAERIRYPAILAFLTLWSFLVYAPWRTWSGSEDSSRTGSRSSDSPHRTSREEPSSTCALQCPESHAPSPSGEGATESPPDVPTTCR